MKKFIGLLIIFSIVFSCKHPTPEQFKALPDDVWYRLIAFSESGRHAKKGQFLQLSASFCTQQDSVFWDSFNNLHDLFFLEADSLSTGKLTAMLSKQEEGDSICLVLPAKQFMKEVYQNDSVPYFMRGDSVVKIYARIKQIVDNIRSLPQIIALENDEYRQIEQYFGGAEQFEKARDPLGFFWIEKPGTSREPIQPGQHIKVQLSGSFLSGRRFDTKQVEQEFFYGSPDQVLDGINYVIARLGDGQTAKIILPSRLAFGEMGSSNGTVPPYTPLLFEVSVEIEN